MNRETVLEMLSLLGQLAAQILDSTFLKDTDTQLYFKVKDAAVILMNCREVREK